jgi:hypothetical protein
MKVFYHGCAHLPDVPAESTVERNEQEGMSPWGQPLNVITRMNATTQGRSRPMVVTFAVILLFLGMTIRFVSIFSAAHVRIRSLAAYIVLAAVISLPYVVIWLIFLGKNWARWIFLVVLGMAVFSLPFVSVQRLMTLPADAIAVYAVQVLCLLTAAIALLSNSSVAFFCGGKNDT